MQNAKQKEESRPKIEQRPFSEFGEPVKKETMRSWQRIDGASWEKKDRKPTQLVVRNN